VALVGAGLTFTGVVAAFTYYGTQKHLEVGYTPDQPVPYSHKLHAGELGIDCRYCHNTVERSSFAAVPSTQTCMNCHWKVKTDSLKLLPVRESYATNKPIPWVKVHNLPDYVYFNHSAHLAAGVGCSSCHGRVDQMIKVGQVSSLTMGWCLDCHRNPGPNIRDPKDITKMDWKPDMTKSGLTDVVAANGRHLSPPQHCSGCHR
jgi:hypothetical protein